MSKRGTLPQLNVSGTQEIRTYRRNPRSFVVLYALALSPCGKRNFRNIVSAVILRDLRVKVDITRLGFLWLGSLEY